MLSMHTLTIPALDIQQRFESTRSGRLAITGLVLAIIAGVVAANLPFGAVQLRASRLTRPYVNALGLDQRWRMFAPIPRNEVLYLEARVRFADGRISIWRPPTDGPLVGAYRDYHWRKLVEHAVPSGDTWPALWRPVARYAARQVSTQGAAPVSVTLVKRSADILPPSRGGGLTPFREQAYYTLRLKP
jgi:hypothetical protein